MDQNPPAADLQLGINPFLLLAVLSIAIMTWVGRSHSNRSAPEMALLAIMSGALIWIAARSRCPPTSLSWFGRLIGNASYAIYFFHPPFVAALLLFGSRIDRNHVAMAISSIAILATGIGILIHLFVEKPLVR